MSIVVDVIIVMFIVFACLLYAKKGLLLAVISSLTLVAAIAAGIFLAPVVKPWVATPDNTEHVRTYCENALFEIDAKVEGGLKDNIDNGLTEAEEKLSLPKSVTDGLREFIEENHFDNKESFIKNVAGYMADIVFTILVFLVIFMLVLIILSVIRIIIEKTREADIMVLHQLDTIGGIIFGFIFAVSLIYVVMFVLSCLSMLGYGQFMEVFKNSYLGGLLYDHNPIGYLQGILLR